MIIDGSAGWPVKNDATLHTRQFARPPSIGILLEFVLLFCGS